MGVSDWQAVPNDKICTGRLYLDLRGIAGLCASSDWAAVAVDSMSVDWTEQAARSASQYLSLSGSPAKAWRISSPLTTVI
ncbi:MAG: hypothetical protein GJ676_13290 [Rhodobacteraceae bacterium]|nr:hypothetical protein [Paracoccaceae bacterium]